MTVRRSCFERLHGLFRQFDQILLRTPIGCNSREAIDRPRAPRPVEPQGDRRATRVYRINKVHASQLVTVTTDGGGAALGRYVRQSVQPRGLNFDERALNRPACPETPLLGKVGVYVRWFDE